MWELTEHERGQNSGRQQVYNDLLSRYLDAQEGRDAHGRSDVRKGQAEMLTWAAMVTFGLDEKDATERVGEDLEERLAARAD